MNALAQLDTSFRSADRVASDGAGSLPSTRSRPDSVRVAAATRKYARREPFRIRLESLSKGSKSSMLSQMLLHQLGSAHSGGLLQAQSVCSTATT